MKKLVVIVMMGAFAIFTLGCERQAKPDPQTIEFEQLTQETELLPDQTVGEEIPQEIAETVSSVPEFGMRAEAPGEDSSAPLSLNSYEFQNPTPQEIQQALQNAGLYSGTIDGSIGPKTKKAIRDFQEKNDLAVDGKVGPKTWSKLSSFLQGQNEATVTVASTELTN